MSFAKKRMLIIIAVILICLVYLQLNHSSLERLLDSKYKNVEILNIDRGNKLVTFSIGSDEQVFLIAKYRTLLNYHFNLYDEEGWSTVRPNPDQFIVFSYKFKVGNVVWGIFNERLSIKKIELKYFDELSHIEYFQTIDINNNSFLVTVPDELIKNNFLNNKWKYDIKAYDKDYKLIIDKTNNNLNYIRSNYSSYY